MGYVHATLMPNENVIYEAKVSLWAHAIAIFFGAILTLSFGFLTVVGLLILLSVYLSYSSTELAVTNKRIVAKFGFIRRQTVELSLAKVETVRIEQGLLGRILGYGSLVIAGAGNPHAPIPGISDPMQFRQKLVEAVDAAQNKSAAAA